ncbi:MAG: hypothetical protein AAF985_26090, partial [Bacteroidota bacterium]
MEGKLTDNKQNENFGKKLGFLFCGISIVMSYTIVGPMGIGLALEAMAKGIIKWTGRDLEMTIFSISLIGAALPLLYYLYALKVKSSLRHVALFGSFVAYLVFLNPALFYKDWINPDAQLSAQRAWALTSVFLNTSWIYILIGAL